MQLLVKFYNNLFSINNTFILNIFETSNMFKIFLFALRKSIRFFKYLKYFLDIIFESLLMTTFQKCVSRILSLVYL